MDNRPAESSYRILITGARGPLTVEQVSFIHNIIAKHAHGRGIVTIVHGACIYGGADLVAEHFAQMYPEWAINEAHPAKDHASPPARNSHMVSLGADLCLGFAKAGSKGTWDCAKKAVEAGIDTMVLSL